MYTENNSSTIPLCNTPEVSAEQGPEHSSARLERYLQMVDENPYEVPKVDESKWFSGGHLGGQIQKLNWQVRAHGEHVTTTLR